MRKPGHPNPKKIVPVLLLLLVIAGIVYYQFNRDVAYLGIAESVIVTNQAEISGKITESLVSLGQDVEKGDVIAVIDSSDLTYALVQMELSLEKARIAEADAKAGAGTRTQSGIVSAQAAVNSASAAANKANQDYEKALTLYQSNAIAESALETAKLQADTARSTLAAAQAGLALARNSSASASSNVDILILESKIDQQKDLIKKCVVTAGESGVIISKNYGAGDFVAPGYDIADIAAANEKYLVVYYPKQKIADVVYHQEVPFVYNQIEYTGTVQFIDVKPQYTPQDFQTPANKNKESVKIKILLPADCPIKPGETTKLLF